MAAELLSELAPGVLAVPGVQLDARRVAFLQAMRQRLPLGFPALIVTSGDRDPADQARAMLGKLAAGGWEELFRIYPDELITPLQALPTTREAWEAEIRAAAQRGVLYSRHMRGDAMDLRIRHLDSEQQKALFLAAREAGGRPLLEDAPPHLHIDHIPALEGRPADPRLNILSMTPPKPITALLSGVFAALASGLGGRR